MGKLRLRLPGGAVGQYVAGDADYVPAINAPRDRGFHVKVAFWQHASAAIKKAASEFLPLNGHLKDLTHERPPR